MNFPTISDADRRCRKRYCELRRLARRHGPDLEDIQRSSAHYIDCFNGHYWVKPAAYAPTGVALGSPLPNPAFTRRLLRLTRCIANYIKRRCPDCGPALAYVPSNAYHVTLANRSHFDEGDTPTAPIASYELNKIRELISTGEYGPLDIHFEGLILTTSGRLIVPGFPCNDRFFKLRMALVENIPALRANIPNTTHIKLAHLYWIPEDAHWGELLDWVARCGEHISVRIQFTSIYTPLAILPLA